MAAVACTRSVSPPSRRVDPQALSQASVGTCSFFENLHIRKGLMLPGTVEFEHFKFAFNLNAGYFYDVCVYVCLCVFSSFIFVEIFEVKFQGSSTFLSFSFFLPSSLLLLAFPSHRAQGQRALPC